MKSRNLPRRAANYLWWRFLDARQATQATLTHWANCVGTRWGWPSRRLRWPLDAYAPYRRPRLHLARSEALGDVLMCTPALRRLKQINPGCHITFYTKFPSLVAGLPFIDEVRSVEDVPADVIWLCYEKGLPPKRHIARIIGDLLGFDVPDVRPSCIVDLSGREQRLTSWEGLPRPWIVLGRHAGPWTPNKEWPEEHWEALIDRLLGWASVIEVGTIPPEPTPRDATRYLNLVGRQSLDDLVIAVSAADLYVGPISGPVHIAAAFGVPSAVIYGGYEEPSCSNYESNIDLATALPCSPCWLREPCPIDRTCLRRISPETVDQALSQLWKRSAARSGRDGTFDLLRSQNR